MKTATKITLMGLAAAILTTGSALASGGEWVTLQSGNFTTSYRRPAPAQATVALTVHGKGIGSVSRPSKEPALRLHRFQAGNNSVSYLAPAE